MFAIAAYLSLATVQLPKTETLAAPLPDWADSLDLESGDDYLNERESTPQEWRVPRPKIRVGDLVGGFEEDVYLVPGDQTRHTRPVGVKFVGEDETDFTLKRNGLIRSASWARENWVSGYIITDYGGAEIRRRSPLWNLAQEASREAWKAELRRQERTTDIPKGLWVDGRFQRGRLVQR